jgi:hypothetical protein
VLGTNSTELSASPRAKAFTQRKRGLKSLGLQQIGPIGNRSTEAIVRDQLVEKAHLLRGEEAVGQVQILPPPGRNESRSIVGGIVVLFDFIGRFLGNLGRGF